MNKIFTVFTVSDVPFSKSSECFFYSVFNMNLPTNIINEAITQLYQTESLVIYFMELLIECLHFLWSMSYTKIDYFLRYLTSFGTRLIESSVLKIKENENNNNGFIS